MMFFPVVFVYKSFAFTACPRSSDPFYIVTYYIKLVTTPWTYSINDKISLKIHKFASIFRHFYASSLESLMFLKEFA